MQRPIVIITALATATTWLIISPSYAAPTCMGERPTILGTSGRDTFDRHGWKRCDRGTRRRRRHQGLGRPRSYLRGTRARLDLRRRRSRLDLRAMVMTLFGGPPATTSFEAGIISTTSVGARAPTLCEADTGDGGRKRSSEGPATICSHLGQARTA
jgi:hypothetical protein